MPCRSGRVAWAEGLAWAALGAVREEAGPEPVTMVGEGPWPTTIGGGLD